MQLNDRKTIGYALLAAGLVLIIYAIYSMANVFTGAASPPALVHMNNITMSIPLPIGGIQAKTELFSGVEISKIINISLWSVLMWFIVSAGSHIGGLGVRLTRDIKVEVKKDGNVEIQGED